MAGKRIYELTENTGKALAGWFTVIQKTAGATAERIDMQYLRRVRIYEVDTSASAQTVNLDAISNWDYEGVMIMDISGNAGTNNITINAGGADLINGGSSFVISKDYGSTAMYATGSTAMQIASDVAPGDLYNIKSIDNTDSPYTLEDEVDLLLIDNSTGAVVVNLPATANGKRKFDAVPLASPFINSVTIQSSTGELVNRVNPWLIQDASYANQIISILADTVNGEWYTHNTSPHDYMEVYANQAADDTPIAAIDTPVKIDVPTSVGEENGGFTSDGGTSNRIKNETGATIKARVRVSATLSEAGGAGDLMSLYIAKNGSTIAKTQKQVTITGNNSQITTEAVVEMADNDYVEGWISNNSNADDPTIDDFTMIVERVI